MKVLVPYLGVARVGKYICATGMYLCIYCYTFAIKNKT